MMLLSSCTADGAAEGDVGTSEGCRVAAATYTEVTVAVKLMLVCTAEARFAPSAEDTEVTKVAEDDDEVLLSSVTMSNAIDHVYDARRRRRRLVIVTLNFFTSYEATPAVAAIVALSVLLSEVEMVPCVVVMVSATDTVIVSEAVGAKLGSGD
jgi:hypothetical protein